MTIDVMFNRYQLHSYRIFRNNIPLQVAYRQIDTNILNSCGILKLNMNEKKIYAPSLNPIAGRLPSIAPVGLKLSMHI